MRHSYRCHFLHFLPFFTFGKSPLILLSFSTMFDLFASVVQEYWPVALLVIVVAFVAIDFFNHGLNRYPGPWLASITNWWRFFDVCGRRPETTHIKLHRQHGDVVRLGPNVLSFANAAAIKQIYGLNKGFVKVGSGENFEVKPTHEPTYSLASTQYRWPCLGANGCHHCSQRQMKHFMPIFVARSIPPFP